MLYIYMLAHAFPPPSLITSFEDHHTTSHMSRIKKSQFVKYPIHQLDYNSVQLTDSPLDDYQKLYFDHPFEKLQFHSSTYKSNVATKFYKENYYTIDPIQKSNHQLNCLEYQFPNLQLHSNPNATLQAVIISNDISTTPVHVKKTSNDNEIVYSLTKNQKFKLQKLDHDLETTGKVINPNNCVIWSSDTGYVFMTGIWRVYQDIMKGLITIDRNDHNNSEKDQSYCNQEFQNTTNKIISNKKSTLLRKDRYIELHWQNITATMKTQLFNEFKNYVLEHEPNVDATLFQNYNMADLIHRIRGGCIKVQGTWFPMELAKLFCIKFAFPIRYLLVPIFGPQFVKDCEDYFLKDKFNDSMSIISDQLSISPGAISPLTKKNELFFENNPRKRSNSISKVYPLKRNSDTMANKFQNFFNNQHIDDLTVERRLSLPAINTVVASPASSIASLNGRQSERLPSINSLLDSLPPNLNTTRRNSIDLTNPTNYKIQINDPASSDTIKFFNPSYSVMVPSQNNRSRISSIDTYPNENDYNSRNSVPEVIYSPRQNHPQGPRILSHYYHNQDSFTIFPNFYNFSPQGNNSKNKKLIIFIIVMGTNINPKKNKLLAP
ncbi:hypothetical protein KAFR_0J01440 [Kazachstania africana CBS 2517]|uniref:HTH APSES-type domain-containing protein n=1 Tax=Kazachstania africana (strain ATCC 22294 / BCRC 22015 / CBS 2517 / CECT 1963 / NBRC 1671 / NRRL Y-8276) TaxID=1071382 RepID=H2B0R1_KAZAF|nr:hypothetical protein KAFR_0J01440 [Kazachstania africana CBS 2517]CCF60211.1 hypothetical protein KAFR_0J01440 [Kazachstania africana CBS 2517]